jgi:hypothetical protein
MKKYLTQLKSDIRPAINNLPDPKTFALLYGEGYETGDLTGVPVKTLAEWFGIDLGAFPPSNKLSTRQHKQMSNILLSYWSPDDELIEVVRALPPKRQYEVLVKYMSARGQYNGYGDFDFNHTPPTKAELDAAREIVDKMMEDMFDDTIKGIADEDLPF